MNKVLFIAKFNETNSYNSVSISKQIPKNKLLCFFNDYKSYELFSKIILSDNNLAKIIDLNLNITNMINEYKNTYSHFIFIHYSDIVFDEEKIVAIANGVKNEPVGIYIEDKHMATIARYEDLIELNRKHCQYKNLFKEIKNMTSKKHIVGHDIIDHKNIPDIINYENDKCLFAFFNERKNLGLVQSYCYFNKNNQKIYNIDNNVLGTVIQHTDNDITIEWNLDSSDTSCVYANENGCFI